MIHTPLPMLGFCAWSGTGKTTLLGQLIPLLRAQGLRIGVIKHAHHGFDLDRPGKDSWTLRKAGSVQTIVASRRRVACILERGEDADEPSLEELIGIVDPQRLDLLLVEGFKQAVFPKIELHRPSMGRPLLCGRMPQIIAVASDTPINLPRPLPLLDLNDHRALCRFVTDYCNDEALRQVAR